MQPIRLDDFLPYRLSVLSHRLSRAIAHVYEERHRLSTSQWRVMAAVAELPGRTAQEVVRVTPMEKTVVSRAVSALIGRGFLRREADDRDGRSSRLYLTPAGDKVYGDILPEARRIEREMLRGLRKSDLESLNRQLDRFEDNLNRQSLPDAR